MADITVPVGTPPAAPTPITSPLAAPTDTVSSAPTPDADPQSPAGQYLASTAQTAQSNFSMALGANPDYEAEMSRLAKQTGVPIDSARAFPAQIKASAAVQSIDFQNLAKQYPTTAALFQDPNSAKMAHDDIHNLTAVEGALPTANQVPLAPGTTGYFAPDNSPLSYGARISNWARNLVSAPPADGNAQGAGGAQAFIQQYAKQNNMSIGDMRDALGGASEIPTQFAQGFENSSLAGLAPDVNGPAQTTAGGVASGVGNLVGFLTGAPLKIAQGAVEKGAAALFEHAAGESFLKATAKDVGAQATTLGLASAITATGQALDQNSPGGALAALGKAGASGAEMGGVFGIVGRVLPDATVVQTLARAVGINTVMDAINGQTPWDNRPTAQKVFDYGLNSVFALHGAGRATGGWVQDAARADTATQDAGTLADIASTASTSALRTRNPDAFKQFVAQANEGSPIQNVYIDAGTLTNALAQSGLKMDDLQDSMPRVADQLPSALATGGDVSIPVEDFATHIAGGPLQDALMPHLKTDPDGMTAQEAQEFYQSHVDSFTKAATAALADKGNDDAVAASAQAVHDNILGQLTDANRFTPDVNKVYAALARDSYTAAGARAGLSPESMFERYPLQIAADDAPGANALDQAAPARDTITAALEKAVADKSYTGRHDFMPVSDAAVQEAAAHGLDIAGYQHSIDGSAITHVLNRHTDLATEASRGQIPITHADFRSIPDVLQSPDVVAYGAKSGSGHDQIIHIKRLADGSLMVLEEQRTGRKTLALTSMRKYPAAKDVGDITATLPSNARSDDGSTKLSIVDRSAQNNLDQAARGKLSFADDITSAPSTITLSRDADLSTFVHELGHFQLEMLSHMSGQEGALPEVSNDFKTVTDWMGTTPEAWRTMSLEEKRPMHEQFARGFEAYLFEGKAPSEGLLGVFQRVRAWMVNVYKSLSNLGVQLSPDVRGVFDRLLATNDAIRTAEAQRAYAPLFKSAEEANMQPDEFAAYHALGNEATLTASDELTARTLRDMRFMENSKIAALRDVKKEVAAKRRDVQTEVETEVAKEPAYQAQEYLRRPATDPATLAAEKEWATRRDEQAKRFVDDARKDAWDKSDEAAAGQKGIQKGQFLAKNKRAIDNEAQRQTIVWEKENPKPVRRDQGNPDLIAEMFGFTDGKAMRKAIADAGPMKDVVTALTDQRMLERYGDITSPDAMSRAANEVIHNEVRTKFIATELKAVAKATGPIREITRAAKTAAETIVARQRVGDISAAKYGAAERRAGREALAAQAKGDTAATGQQKRNQLLNNQLERVARDAATEVLKSVQYLKRFNKDATRAKLDVDVREQIDDMLARFDLRANPVDTPTRKQINLEKWVDSQVALGMAPNVSDDMLNQAYRQPYRDMTLEAFRGLTDAVKSLEKIGRDRKTATIAGEKQDIATYVNEKLVPKMQARGEQFTDAQLFDKPTDRHNNPFKVALDHVTSWLRAGRAQLKPQEFKRNQYDMHELLGPFGEAIYEPVFAANYREVDMLKGMSDDFKAMAEKLGRPWQDGLRDQIPNARLLDVNRSADGAPVPLRITRGKMLGIALHVGNESNFDKLTAGWKWNAQDVWQMLHDNMTANDWKAVQSVWDQYDKHWPDMQAMARRLGNTAPERIEPRAFQTKFGEQRGGYAAIKYDALRSRRGEKDAAGRAIDPAQGLFNSSYYRPDTTTNGSMNARNQGYTDVVDLDFHSIPQTMHETIHDLAYREALIDVNKIISNSDFRKAFQKTYGPESYRSLQEWLGKLANTDNQDREIGALGKILQYSRTGMVINGIAFRISTVLKHGGSAAIKTSGYFTGGGEKYLASRFAAIGTNYRAEITGAQQKFPEIRARLLQQDRDFRAMSANLFEPEGKIAKGERFGHAAVAWSDMMTAVPTAWAAYDRAVTDGIPVNMGGTGAPMTEEQAVAYASKVVREAHGSNITSARSMVINNSSEAVKMFTTLYGFMNNTYGQGSDMVDKLKMAGISNPQTLARGFMALIVPALWAGYLTQGSPTGDKDGWVHWIAKAIGGEAAGMVPFVRDAAAMVEGYSSAGQVGVESWMAGIVKAGMDAAHLAQGKPVNAPIKDIANAAGMGLHIPGLGQLGGSVQYAADVATGKQHPAGPAEYAAGIVLGHGASKH